MKLLFWLSPYIVLLVNCQSFQRVWPDLSKVNKIEITYFNKINGKGNDLLKTISLSQEVSQIVSFAKNRILHLSESNSDLCKLLEVQDRSTSINFRLYDDTEYYGVLGVGYIAQDKYFLKYYYYGQSIYKCISIEEKNELLNLMQLSAIESNKLHNELFDPEVWFGKTFNSSH